MLFGATVGLRSLKPPSAAAAPTANVSAIAAPPSRSANRGECVPAMSCLPSIVLTSALPGCDAITSGGPRKRRPGVHDADADCRADPVLRAAFGGSRRPKLAQSLGD